MVANPASDATWKEYVSAVVPVDAAFLIVSVSGCSANLNCWASAGDDSCGAVTVMPVLTSIELATTCVDADANGEAVGAEGDRVVADLLPSHATVATTSASVPHTVRHLGFMCSYPQLVA